MLVIVGIISYLFGVITTFVFFLLLAKRIINRFEERKELAATVYDLESRRAGFESGRQHKARHNSGAKSRITDGMATKPGSLAQWHQAGNGDK